MLTQHNHVWQLSSCPKCWGRVTTAQLCSVDCLADGHVVSMSFAGAVLMSTNVGVSFLVIPEGMRGMLTFARLEMSERSWLRPCLVA